MQFGFEKIKEEYIKNIKNKKDYRKKASIIARILKKSNVKTVISMGCGKGILEYYLKKLLPDITIVCTDYTKEAIKTLEKYSNCDRFEVFDMLKGDYSQFGKDTCLIFHRVEPELDLKQWKNIFKEIYKNQGLK